jgi:hypothetical protein
VVVTGHVDPQGQKLTRLVTETVRTVRGDVEHERHRITGFAHYPLDAQRREVNGSVRHPARVSSTCDWYQVVRFVHAGPSPHGRILRVEVATTRLRRRVIAGGTGAVGSEMLTAIIDHPDLLEIVGARVYSADKDGAEIGVLVGREPIGVTATTDVDRVLALDAYCVLYTPRNTDIDEVCAILSSGKNVATTAFLFHPPRASPATATAC